MSSWFLLLAAMASQAAPTPAPDASATRTKTHLLVAEAVRVDAQRRWLVVKTADQPPVELRIGVEEGKTRVTAGGKLVRLEDVRPQDRVSISCDDAAGTHTARLIVIRPRGAPATPGPRPSPSPEAPSTGLSPPGVRL